MTPSHLTELVDQAYEAFAGRPPRDVGVCTGCCMDPKDASRLLGLPVREIPLGLLVEWMEAATDNEFPSAIWLHLLPRILELLAQGEDPTRVGVEVSLRRGRNRTMSQAQRTVLDRFQTALLAYTAAHSPHDLDATLCMLALGGWPVHKVIVAVAARRITRQVLSLGSPPPAHAPPKYTGSVPPQGGQQRLDCITDLAAHS